MLYDNDREWIEDLFDAIDEFYDEEWTSELNWEYSRIRDRFEIVQISPVLPPPGWPRDSIIRPLKRFKGKVRRHLGQECQVIPFPSERVNRAAK